MVKELFVEVKVLTSKLHLHNVVKHFGEHNVFSVTSKRCILVNTSNLQTVWGSHSGYGNIEVAMAKNRLWQIQSYILHHLALAFVYSHRIGNNHWELLSF